MSSLNVLTLVLFVIGVIYQVKQRPARGVMSAGVVAGAASLTLAAANQGLLGILIGLAGLATFSGLILLAGALLSKVNRQPVKLMLYPGLILLAGGLILVSSTADQQIVSEARQLMTQRDWDGAIQALARLEPDSRAFTSAQDIAYQARTGKLLANVQEAIPDLAAGRQEDWDELMSKLAATDPGQYDRQTIAAAIVEAAEGNQMDVLVALLLYQSAQTIDPQVIIPEDLKIKAADEAMMAVELIVAANPAEALAVIARYRGIFLDDPDEVAWFDQKELEALTPQLDEIEKMVSDGQITSARERLLTLAAANPRQPGLPTRAKELEMNENKTIQQVADLRATNDYDQALALVRQSPDIDRSHTERLRQEIEQERKVYLAAEEMEEARKRLIAQEIARSMVEKRLKAPRTARWVSLEVMEQDDHDRFLVHVVVDAQNAFGALIRGSYLVVFRITDVKQGAYQFGQLFAVQESGNPPAAMEIEIMKEINNWGDAE